MPVRVRADPPGVFIKDHLVSVGGVDYVQSIFRAYKKYLLESGMNNGTCRETMSKYIWLAKKLGMIVFDHAESPAYWDALVDMPRVTVRYRPEPRPRAPSPRHYYRLVDQNDPRWLRLEASYRASIGIEVPPAFPRVPYVPPPVPAALAPAPIAAPPRPPAPAPAPAKKPRPSRATKVKKPTPAEKAAEVLAPFEARKDRLVLAIDQLGRTPSFQLTRGIEDELESLSRAVAEAIEGKRGLTRERLVGLDEILRRALHDVPLLNSSVRTLARETLPARMATALTAFDNALRVVREDLTG